MRLSKIIPNLVSPKGVTSSPNNGGTSPDATYIFNIMLNDSEGRHISATIGSEPVIVTSPSLGANASEAAIDMAADKLLTFTFTGSALQAMATNGKVVLTIDAAQNPQSPNVGFTVSNIHIDQYNANVNTTMAMRVGGYKYGFNGMEKDDEIKGSGNSYDFGARMLDVRLGKFLSADPLASWAPGWSPYRYGFDNPINCTDPTGLWEDHWQVDDDGNATLLDTEGDDIYVNDQLLSDFDFTGKESALSSIGTYYHNQAGGSSLFNDKISVLNYENYSLSGSSNWGLDTKPYNGQSAPRAFAYSSKQYGTADDRIVLPTDGGHVSTLLNNKFNFQSILSHEDIHLGQPLDKYSFSEYGTYFELDAYKGQMQHSSWGNTTGSFKRSMLLNANDYLNNLENSGNTAIEKAYLNYKGFFNSVK